MSIAPIVGPDDPRRFTDSGIEVKELYDEVDLPHDLEARLGEPGDFPYTRGVHREMYRKQLWTMRQYAGYASAKESNERYHYLLKHGSTGLSMAFDLPTQLGLDSDDPRCLGEVGRTGVAIDTIDDMRTAFDGIPLDEVSTSMTINAPASVLLCLYQLVGEEQGVEPAKLRGTTQNDILKEYIARGNFIYPPEASMRLTTDLFAYCNENVPRWNTISISGYHFREKGCSAVQEVAFTLANGLAYVQAALDAGLKVDDFAPRLAFFFNGHNNVFQEVAKFRAARRMWANFMADRFGAQNPKSLMLRFHTQTGGVTLTAQQPQNNIMRVALQGFAAVCGGTQSLHTNGYDEALALPSRARGEDRAAHAAGHRARVGRRRHRRPVRRLVLRRGPHGRHRAAVARADRQGRRARRLGRGDRVHQERDRGVRLGLSGALRQRPGHRRRRQQVRRGGARRRGHPARRPRVREAAARAVAGVQGRPRPGGGRHAPRGAARRRPGRRQPPALHPHRAQGPRVDGRGLRRDARRLRRVPAERLNPSPVAGPANVRLTLAISDYDHVRDLISGRVPVEGVDLTCLDLGVEEIFFRFTRYREWDVSELSMAKYCALRARGDDSLTAIPAFVSRSFRHSAFYVRADAPRDDPGMLRGARIGIPEWAVTATVVGRGLLTHEFGIDLAEIDWIQGGTNEPGRIETLPTRLPTGVAVAPERERSLTELLLDGEIAAILAPHPPDAAVDGSGRVVRLFTDHVSVEREYYLRTGFFPIMHVVAVKTEAYRSHPWIARNLLEAFGVARDRSVARALDTTAPRTPVPWASAHAESAVETFGTLWPYGIEPNRLALETFLTLCWEQGVCERVLEPEELFAPETQHEFRI